MVTINKKANVCLFVTWKSDVLHAIHHPDLYTLHLTSTQLPALLLNVGKLQDVELSNMDLIPWILGWVVRANSYAAADELIS